MLALARAMVVLSVVSVLAGCGLPVPANATPCEKAPGTRECDIWMANHMGH
jgi:predicted small lipoprotein YifL